MNFIFAGGKRAPSSGQDVKREQSSSFPSNASQKFTMQVAQSVLGGTNAVTSVISTPPPTINAAPLPVQAVQNDAVVNVVPRPSTSAPPESTIILPSKEVSVSKKYGAVVLSEDSPLCFVFMKDFELITFKYLISFFSFFFLFFFFFANLHLHILCLRSKGVLHLNYR